MAAEEGRKKVMMDNVNAEQERAVLKNAHEQEMAEVQGRQYRAELVQSTNTMCSEKKVKADQVSGRQPNTYVVGWMWA